MRISYTNYADIGTLTAPTVIAGYPVASMQDERLAKAFRTTTLSTMTVTVTLAASTVITAVAILGHNFTSSATVVFTGNTAYSMIASVPTILNYLTASAAITSCTFTVTDPTNTDGYLKIGRLWVGDYVTIDPSSLLDFTVTKKRSDQIGYSTNRAKFGLPGVGWRQFDLSFPRSTNAMTVIIENMFNSVGNHSSVIFSNFDSIRSYQIVEPCYCTIANEVTFNHQEYMQFTYGLTLEEDK